MLPTKITCQKTFNPALHREVRQFYHHFFSMVYYYTFVYTYGCNINVGKGGRSIKKSLKKHLYAGFLVRIFPLEEVLIVCTKFALHKAFLSSPQRSWTSIILSTDLQIPLHLQSNEAAQILPA